MRSLATITCGADAANGTDGLGGFGAASSLPCRSTHILNPPDQPLSSDGHDRGQLKASDRHRCCDSGLTDRGTPFFGLSDSMSFDLAPASNRQHQRKSGSPLSDVLALDWLACPWWDIRGGRHDQKESALAVGPENWCAVIGSAPPPAEFGRRRQHGSDSQPFDAAEAPRPSACPIPAVRRRDLQFPHRDNCPGGQDPARRRHCFHRQPAKDR